MSLSGKVPVEEPCPHCHAEGQHFYSIWESRDGAEEQERHECHACHKVWWNDAEA